MRSSTIISALAFIAPIFAAPTPANELGAGISVATPQLESRDKILTCKPTTDKSKTKFKVDAKLAKSQAAVAGFTPGKSGDPHRFHNGERIRWGESDCDKSDATLWEYPLYWMGAPGSSKGKAVWDKDTKSSKQQSTPIRVVYAQVSNKAVYCGVMIHGTVEASFQGKGAFEKCT